MTLRDRLYTGIADLNTLLSWVGSPDCTDLHFQAGRLVENTVLLVLAYTFDSQSEFNDVFIWVIICAVLYVCFFCFLNFLLAYLQEASSTKCPDERCVDSGHPSCSMCHGAGVLVDPAGQVRRRQPITLQFVVDAGDPALLVDFLKAGGSPDDLLFDGSPPLYYAVRGTEYGMVDALLGSFVDLPMVMRYERTYSDIMTDVMNGGGDWVPAGSCRLFELLDQQHLVNLCLQAAKESEDNGSDPTIQVTLSGV